MITKNLYFLRNTRKSWIVLVLVAIVLQGCAQVSNQFTYQHGVSLLKSHRYKQAHESALALHRSDPENLQYTALLAWTWFKQGNQRKAEALFESILRKKPGDIGGLQGMAWVYYEKKEFSAAHTFFLKDISWAKKLMKTDAWEYYNPVDRLYVESIMSDAYYGLGLIAVARREHGTAQADLRKSLSYPNSFIGDAPIRTALAEAEHARNKVFRKNHASDHAKKLGYSYFEHADFANALRYFRIHLRRSPNDGQALITAAYCQLYLGRYTDSLTEFKRLSRNPHVPKDQALTGEGVALIYLGRLSEAENVLRHVVKTFPGNVRARVDLGDIAYLKGNYRKAIRIFSANLQYLPKKDAFFSWPSYALNYLGWAYYYTGRYTKALECFERLEGYHPYPVYPIIYNGLGWSSLKLHRKPEARRAFRKALLIEPKNKLALSGLAALAQK